MTGDEDHFERLVRLLDLETAAETERLATRRWTRDSDAEVSGESLLDLVVDDHDSGLGGRYLLTFVKRNRTLRLPWNRLRVGAPVVLSPHDSDQQESWTGIVSARSADSIQVAVNDWPEAEQFRLDLSPDEITRKRQRQALQAAVAARGRPAELRRVLTGEGAPEFAAEEPDVSFTTSLDPSQQAAVRFALAARDVAIIHGPPGTGKTTTVVELIRQAVLREERVLACAPSNTAVDNLLERLAGSGINVVRVGHPARVLPGLRRHTLDARVESHEIMRLVRDMMREAEQLYRKAGRYTRARPAPGARQEMRREARELRSHARLMEQQAVEQVLDQADVICATTSYDPELLRSRLFDLVVVDEACQSTEAGCWGPALCAGRLVLAGDHCQLPPTVISDQAAREGLAVSLQERLVSVYGDKITRRLGVQYRMHEHIMGFSSRRFYEGTLQADDSVRSHVLADLEFVEDTPLTREPFTLIDTAGSGWEEQLEPDGESKRNTGEGEFVLRKVQQLREAGLPSREIAVIAPYAAQVRWLREQQHDPALEIDTVDGFQGREKEAVIISLVRSNQNGEIGFLADTRRMNVALTRARRKLIVVGDSATLASHEFYDGLLRYAEEVGGYHTVWEE